VCAEGGVQVSGANLTFASLLEMFASLALYTSPPYSYPTFQARPYAAAGRCALSHCAEQFGRSQGYRLDNGVSGNIIAVGNNGTCAAVAQAARRSGVAVVRGNGLPGGRSPCRGKGTRGPRRRERGGRGEREGRSAPPRPYPWTSAWRIAPRIHMIYLYLCVQGNRAASRGYATILAIVTRRPCAKCSTPSRAGKT
jgi:hypothetical protein